jgi:hypothetical protein
MHKFHLGQMVTYRAPGGRLYASAGAYVVTARFPERDGEFEYHIRHMGEQHERMARESGLSAIDDTAEAKAGVKPEAGAKAKRKPGGKGKR